MKTLVTGHRLFKLEAYDTDWIKLALAEVLAHGEAPTSWGYSGMASGVDLVLRSVRLAGGALRGLHPLRGPAHGDR